MKRSPIGEERDAGLGACHGDTAGCNVEGKGDVECSKGLFGNRQPRQKGVGNGMRNLNQFRHEDQRKEKKQDRSKCEMFSHMQTHTYMIPEQRVKAKIPPSQCLLGCADGVDPIIEFAYKYATIKRMMTISGFKIHQRGYVETQLECSCSS